MKILGMFARCPRPGETKTRLAAAIGNAAAAQVYAAFVEDLLNRGAGPADRLVAAVTPECAETAQWFKPRLRPGTALWFQPEGDLGARIEWFFREADASDQNHVVLTGSDSPDLPIGIVQSAFEQLTKTDVVIGPATDGGFVLIGLSVPPASLFQHIEWSAADTLTSVLRACDQLNFRVVLLQPWYDVDTIENLGTLAALQQVDGSGAAKCPNTCRVLGEFPSDFLALRDVGDGSISR